MDQVKRKTGGRMSRPDHLWVPDRAFSLVELLAVMAIIVIIIVFSVPMFTSISQGSNLNRAGQILGDHLSLARQKAVTLNRDIEMRFYQFPGVATSGWRGVQLVQIDQTPTGPMEKPVTRVVEMPTGISMVDRDNLSPLIASSPHSGTAKLTSRGDVKYRSFRFRADGSTDAADIANNFVTLAQITDSATPPRNFYTLQVNPVTGKVSVFRP
jgi:uncharacterized protein (TIGR02596 family)